MCQKVGIPVLGVVENESYFICDGCDKRHELFGKGGGQKVAEFADAPLLGQIPIDPSVREWGDAGTPVVQAAPRLGHRQGVRRGGRAARRSHQRAQHVEARPAHHRPQRRQGPAAPARSRADGRMQKLTVYLFDKNYSSWSMRGWLAAELSGLPYTEINVGALPPSEREAVQGRSPSGLFPMLEHGELTIWDSLAIGEYLAELAPTGSLWPASRDDRAVARSISAEMHSGFGVMRSQMPMNIRAHYPGFARTTRGTEGHRADSGHLAEVSRAARPGRTIFVRAHDDGGCDVCAGRHADENL